MCSSSIILNRKRFNNNFIEDMVVCDSCFKVGIICLVTILEKATLSIFDTEIGSIISLFLFLNIFYVIHFPLLRSELISCIAVLAVFCALITLLLKYFTSINLLYILFCFFFQYCLKGIFIFTIMASIIFIYQCFPFFYNFFIYSLKL